MSAVTTALLVVMQSTLSVSLEGLSSSEQDHLILHQQSFLSEIAHWVAVSLHGSFTGCIFPLSSVNSNMNPCLQHCK